MAENLFRNLREIQDMGLELLMQRNSLYAFVAGTASTAVVVLIASLLDVILPIVLFVLIGIALTALCVLLGATSINPGASGSEADSSFGGGDDMPMGNTTNSRGALRSPAEVSEVLPTTRLEFVMYFSGFGVCAVGALALLLR
jgi:hypothetical protein